MQTLKDIEVILSDGGSRDKTLDVACSFLKRNSIRYLVVQKPGSSIYGAMNLGLKVSTGTWLYFMGADDMLAETTTLESLSPEFADARIDVIYGDAWITSKNRLWCNGKFNSRALGRWTMPHQATFYRRQTINKYGLEYNENYPIEADWDFNLRLWKYVEFRFVDRVICNFSGTGTSSHLSETPLYDNLPAVLIDYYGLGAFAFLPTYRLADSFRSHPNLLFRATFLIVRWTEAVFRHLKSISQITNGLIMLQLMSILKYLSSIAGSFQSQRIQILHKLRASAKNKILYITEYPLQSIGQEVVQSEQLRYSLIPPHVYQIWIADAFGRTHARELRKFRALNPSMSFKLFTHSEADDYISSCWSDSRIEGIYNAARFQPLKADIFRYCILYERGGYYFDINKGCSTPIDQLHRPSDRRLISYETSFCNVMPELATTYLFQYPNRYMIQWGFGFAPKDPILEHVINLICSYYPYFKGKTFEDPKAAILAFTGPGMFTKAVREVVQDAGKLEGAQAGVNFNGHGIPWMQGSEIRYHLSPPYVLAQNAVIVD